jgi:hypothetical protein
MDLGISEIAILGCWGSSILIVIGTLIYLIVQKVKKK